MRSIRGTRRSVSGPASRSLALAAFALLAPLVAGCGGGDSNLRSGGDDAGHADAAHADAAHSEAGRRDAGHHDAGQGDDADHPDSSPHPPPPDAASPDSGVADTGHPPPADAGPVAITLNDVSILFPLPTTEAGVDDLLAPSAAGAQGTLLPSAIYASAGPITGSTFETDAGAFQELAAYGALRVVAMRLDPCFASLDPDPHGAGCTAQVRLVFQEVDWVSSSSAPSATAFDSALHAFYDLSRRDLLSLAAALVELRVANAPRQASGPLAPNAIMAQQGLGGAMSKGVQRLILQYAGKGNLVRLAQLSTIDNELEEIWSMSAFDVSADATVATPRRIPSLSGVDGGVLVEGIGGGSSAPGPDGGSTILKASFGPTTVAHDDYTPLDDGKPWKLSASARQAAEDALVRVENPRDTSANTVDCASCHVATPTEVLVAMPLFGFDDTRSSLSFEPDGRSVTNADMTPTYAAYPGQFNIHAFSYFGTLPGISQRTVNETAAVVEYLNDLPR